ncbi:MAG: hypothetical protein EON60_10255 [Alphaproteobacteria bacterium]|nr:MAG: hypothetical protein EON60_10255 [Alphaproteobacteria bacterium]
MANLPFLSGNKPEKPKPRDFRLGDKLYLKQPSRIFPEITTDMVATVVPYIHSAHGIEVQPIYSAGNPTVLVQIDSLDNRRFCFPPGKLETREQRQWRLDHPDDPVPDIDPYRPRTGPTRPLPPAGSVALPAPEEPVNTDAVSKQAVNG